MREKLIDDNLMLRYLLGDLPETEQLRLEECFFTDDEFYQQMLALEDELKYDYAQGLLTTTQRAQFEQRFLATPEKRQQAAVAGLLLDKLSKTDLPPTDAPPARRAWWQILSALFSMNNPIMQAGLAAAAIVFFLGGSWLLSDEICALSAMPVASHYCRITTSSRSEPGLRGTGRCPARSRPTAFRGRKPD